MRSLLTVIQGTRMMRIPEGRENPQTQLNLFVALVHHGKSDIRSVLESAGLNLRDFVFFLAHGEPESSSSLLDKEDHRTAQWGIEMVNDDYTPMEFVVTLLQEDFGIERESAVETMLKVHHEGREVFWRGCFEDAIGLAQNVNSETRRQYFPLFCRVVAQ